MSENFQQLFEQSAAYKHMRSGDIVAGTVVGMEKDFVIVNVGLKSDGAIPVAQFEDHQGQTDVNVGDVVDVYVETIEDGFGETRLSYEKAKRAASWIELEKSMEDRQTVIGHITGKVKGGFIVDVKGVRAFLPGSLVDVRPMRDTSYLEGKEIDFKVIKMDKKRSNVVVSRRAVVEEEQSGDRKALLENLQDGQVVKGIVKNLTDYGVFVDLGGVDGLLHITDMSWKRIKHPSEMVKMGDEIDVKVLHFDRDKGRVSLGMKQMGDDPWVDVAGRFPVGTRLTGRVTNITDYGCFVEIENGVEGLVHMSEMDWTNKNIHPSKVVALGEEKAVMVLEIDETRRRISLGMKQCQDNPWESFAKSFKEGDKVKGSIKSITDFGIFIGLDGQIDGLIHLSDISWSESGEAAVRNFSKGQEVEAMVLGIDPERERISLGIKQLDHDVFSQYVNDNPVDSKVSGKVLAVSEAGDLDIELADGLSAQLTVAEMTKDAIGKYAEGDKIEVRIANADKRSRHIELSLKAKAARKAAPKAAANTTLGDLIKAKMEDREEGDA
ncbi:MAG: 30S ribosomal protein S1 [Gammaproteobacteria bacterium CG11_big_fil_rev_8_21_14_0_20_46_22]|nr:MAG: 30S ribosomal protein S1 [Gammaproteobacteria bacterium CG12_big_fil_rev_8_21_14_0_65_46_12]PIR10748.1 MAG: 30S ribosomal protein S1 [Gammaproteobacteria bacterium CG11_big_fil_rev_8_21_14_0_20_46_22]